MATHAIDSLQDTRLTELRRVGGGEGFGLYAANFEGRPCVIVDSSTMNDLLDEDDALKETIQVMVFSTEQERAAYLTKFPKFCFGEP